MHRRRIARRATTAVTAAIALLATSAVTAAPAAFAHQQGTDLTAAVAGDPEKKFTSAAREQLRSEKTAAFWIEFTDRADLEPAKDIADWAERGRYVVDTLQETSEAAQADVIKQLEAAGVDYESYWINNSIYVEDGTLALADRVAASGAVEGIHEQFEMLEIAPVKTEPANEKLTTAVEWGVSEINAPEVWDLGFTGAGITVASFDTGVDGSHPALADKYRGMGADGSIDDDYNWFDVPGGCGGSPCDTQGHGTHTTGTMVGDDGAGNQVGVAPDATWIAANCIDNAGCTRDDYLADAQWFLAPTRADGSDPDPAMRPHVINNSWGIPPGAPDPYGWMRDETLAWDAAGIFGAWAAGNEGSACETARFPGEYENTYAVGAYDVNGNIASFSSRGPGENGVTTPNIAAPGVNVRSSVPGGGYSNSSGTSMATPHLAGAVALLWSAAPALVGDIEGTKAVLNQTAIDTEDLQCGGTAGENHVWGEGKLDIAAAIDAAPTAGTGTVEGTVTDAADAPIAGATVLLDGERDRTVTTGEDGAFSATVVAGDYDVSASAFGYLDSTSEPVTVAEDETVTVPITLEAAPRHSVSGVVTFADGGPVAGAPVSLGSHFDDVTTAEDGSFAFADVPEGTYPLSVTMGGCASSFAEDVVVDGDLEVPVTIEALVDERGYSCSVSTGEYLQGDTDTGLSGDDGSTTVSLPFDFTFYGESYDTAHVTTNGHVNFLAATTAYSNVSIPATSVPNAAIYPFWDDLYFVSGESGLYEGTTTVDGTDAYVLEFRDVALYGDRDARLDFSVTLLADGDIVLGYGELAGGGDTAAGSSATVGIEDEAGAVGLEYSYNSAALSEGLSVTYDAPPLATLSGIVKDHNTKDPVAGATVTMTGADGSADTLTTGDDGRYSAVVALGQYDLEFSADDYVTVDKRVTLAEDGEAKSRNAQLKAGLLTVDKEAVSVTKRLGGAPATRGFVVANEGSAPADLSVGTAGGDFDMLGLGGGSAGVINHVEGEATELDSQEPGVSIGGSRGSRGGLSTSSLDAGVSAFPAVSVPQAETTITHSTSQEVVALNSASCGNAFGTSENSFLRTFTLSDFGIDGSFAVSEVSFGIEEATAQTLTVNLYQLVGDDFVYANLEQLGSAQVDIEAQTLSMVSVPVEGEISGGTLVVEVVTPNLQDTGGVFYIGSNGDGQTAPSYLKADDCGIAEPAATDSIGWPDMHIVMNVSGSTGGAGGGDAAWLDAQPGSVTLDPGESVRIVATIDPRAVDQPGTYTADVVLGADTPYAEPTVAATLTANPPGNWGKITGTVADGAGTPLDGATVHLDGLEKDVTLVTGGDGTYEYWMGVSNNALTMIVAKDGYVPQVRTGTIVRGQTVTYDFALDALV
ncbi:carboxypeptidase regulatory-like domain-containing protein [Myceligenerans salitolerans]|uniref:carboxypeptidase regulatory-like domain-containing protein n=1 Tax=Myceligenerans salitolerans TaxID=1230528 RepID=UPI001F5E9AEC|nr:carboxypeptidase regulatory-like domain-containing protein [Myceligenerans salitolerans]